MPLEKTWNGPGGDKDFERAPDGTYKCVLLEINEVERSKFGKPDETVIKWQFVYETTEVGDSGGNPFKFFETLSRGYGHENSGLTKRMDTMLGKRLTMDEWMESEHPDDLIGKTWDVLVTNNTTTKDGVERTYTNVVKVTPPAAAKKLAPLKGKGKAGPEPEQTPADAAGDAVPDFGDPFKDE